MHEDHRPLYVWVVMVRVTTESALVSRHTGTARETMDSTSATDDTTSTRSRITVNAIDVGLVAHAC